MVGTTSIGSGIKGFISSLAGSEFFIWLVAVPILFIAIVTVPLYNFLSARGNYPDFLKSTWFAFVYMAIMYVIAVVLISLVFGFIN